MQTCTLNEQWALLHLMKKIIRNSATHISKNTFNAAEN